MKKTKAKRSTRLKKGWKVVKSAPEEQWDPKTLKALMKSWRRPVKFNFIKRPISGELFDLHGNKGTVSIVDADGPGHKMLNQLHSDQMDALRYATATPKAATRGELGAAPAHYSNGKYTPWEIVDDWKLEYYCGNALKYVCRHKHKGTPEQDIQKAIDCLIQYKNNLSNETK